MTAHQDTADTAPALFKIVVAWALTIFGNVTLQQVATLLAIIYTSIQIYILIRDKIIRDRLVCKPPEGGHVSDRQPD